MRKWLIVLVGLTLALGIAVAVAGYNLAGGGTTAEPEVFGPVAVSHGGPAKDYVSLVDNLRAAGATVDPTGEVSQPFFSIQGYVITVNGGNVQVFEHADAASANAEAARISPDGYTITAPNLGTIVDWIAPPHFYKKGKLIVLYVGDNRTVISMLEAVLGPQFAGK